MPGFEAFFVVGVTPGRCLRQAKYEEDDCHKKSSPPTTGWRRLKLKPETVIAFPGSVTPPVVPRDPQASSANEETSTNIRDSTTLESAIVDFCFPAGMSISTVLNLKVGCRLRGG